MSKTVSEAPPLARNATVPVSVAKQECPSRCRKLNLRHLHWRETPWYLSLLPNRSVLHTVEIHVRKWLVVLVELQLALQTSAPEKELEAHCEEEQVNRNDR